MDLCQSRARIIAIWYRTGTGTGTGASTFARQKNTSTLVLSTYVGQY